MVSNILRVIGSDKRKEVEVRKWLAPIDVLEQSPYFPKPVFSLKERLCTDSEGIIAEYKRKSPTKGVINGHAPIRETLAGYVQAGATALSILTDTTFFGGSNYDLTGARPLLGCPILRKDFVIDEYQVVESKAIGADVILLIAALLQPGKLKSLVRLAHSLGLEVLMEVHSAGEFIAHANSNADIIGVNNRDLTTFEVSLDTSRRLAGLIARNAVSISESGIRTAAEVMELKSIGYKGFLIGEAFMQNVQPATTLRELLRDLRQLKSRVL